MSINNQSCMKKPPEKSGKERKYQHVENAGNNKPLRFQFGSDATEADIERFLDMIFGKEERENDLDKKSLD